MDRNHSQLRDIFSFLFPNLLYLPPRGATDKAHVKDLRCLLQSEPTSQQMIYTYYSPIYSAFTHTFFRHRGRLFDLFSSKMPHSQLLAVDRILQSWGDAA